MNSRTMNMEARVWPFVHWPEREITGPAAHQSRALSPIETGRRREPTPGAGEPARSMQRGPDDVPVPVVGLAPAIAQGEGRPTEEPYAPSWYWRVWAWLVRIARRAPISETP